MTRPLPALEAISGVMSGLGSKSSSGGGGAVQQQGPSVGQTTASTGGGGGSNQTTGVTHLAAGGIVTGPTRADLGESGEEAVIPLTDPEAMARLTGLFSQSTLRAGSSARAASAASMAPPAFDEAAMERVVSRAAGSQRDSFPAPPAASAPQINVHVKGLLDAGNLKKIIAKQNRMVQNRQVTVKSTDSFRITRRSQ